MWKLNGNKLNLSKKKLEKAICAALSSGIDVHNNNNPLSPLILASPHSGRHYPKEFQALTKLSLYQLRLGEDAFVDKLIEPLLVHGIPTLQAQFPRCFVDVNRAPEEIPPEYMGKSKKSNFHASERAQSGLGVIPRRIAQNQDIYEHEISPRQVSNRLARFYHPYHAQLQSLLDGARNAFGHALLFDCHSMPGHGPNGEKRPDIILGDRFGRSCDAATICKIETGFKTMGYSVSKNYPYAGGYVTEHYGNPHNSVETLQIEFNKDLYLNPVTFEPHSGLEGLRSDFEKIVLQFIEGLVPATEIAAQ